VKVRVRAHQISLDWSSLAVDFVADLIPLVEALFIHLNLNNTSCARVRRINIETFDYECVRKS
jgi:hypothetical protein